MEDGIESVYGVRMTLVWWMGRYRTMADYRLSTIDYQRPPALTCSSVRIVCNKNNNNSSRPDRRV